MGWGQGWGWGHKEQALQGGCVTRRLQCDLEQVTSCLRPSKETLEPPGPDHTGRARSRLGGPKQQDIR